MVRTPSSRRSRALQLGAELREARKQAGMTVEQVAERLKVHQSTVSRWERGEVMPSEADTAAMLTTVRVTGDDFDRMVELARHDNLADWVAPGINKQLAALIQYERTAYRITELNPLLIPGLLQTADYARAQMMNGGVPRGQAEQRTIVRMGRQNVLTRRRPVSYVAIIGEQALRYPPCPEEVQADQLQHLLDVAEYPNVQVYVFPFATRYAPALDGQFVLLEFERDRPVVQVGSAFSTSTLVHPNAVESYQKTVDNVLDKIPTVDESRAFIRDILNELENE